MYVRPNKPATKEARLFGCSHPDCGKLFKSKFSRDRHAVLHSLNKHYSCRLCKKEFALKQHLVEHSHIHTQEKPYVCGVAGCQERFGQSGKLALHRRTHPEYAVKRYDNHAHHNAPKRRRAPDPEDSACLAAPPTRLLCTRLTNLPPPDCFPLDPPHKVVTAEERALIRQDTGPTMIGPSGSIEGVEGSESVPLQEPDGRTKGSQSSEGKPLANMENTLMDYLKTLHLHSAIAVRPVLPLPLGWVHDRPLIHAPLKVLALTDLLAHCGEST